MTRDEVLQQFGRKSCIDSSGKRVEWIDNPWSRITEAMADRIVELTERLAAVEAERNAEKQRRREIDDEAFVYAEQVEVMRRRALRAEAILAALRDQSDAVSDAAFESFYGVDMPKSLLWAIRAAVAAAEKEVNDGKP